MPRPRKDQEGPSAVERMEEAFWDALAEKPYGQITVGEIAKRAQVNKNAFYYHFDGLHALAAQAIGHTLLREMARMLLLSGEMENGPSSAQLTALASRPDLVQRTYRIGLVAGKHGSRELVAVLKRLILDAWFELFDVEASNLSAEAVTTIRFALGGMLELVGDDGYLPDNANLVRTLLASGIAETVAASVVAALRSAARERPHGAELPRQPER